MQREQPLTQTLRSSQARDAWGQILDQVACRETRVVVERDGVPVAAIVSTDDLARLEQLEQQRQRDLATLRASQDGFKDEPADDVEREIARALSEVRAERATHDHPTNRPT